MLTFINENPLLERSREMDDNSRARDKLNRVIELIPHQQKNAYLEALQRAPHLVETESDPICFLQCDNYNCWDAANRIVAYWEERRKIFGSKKAFLPLTLVGESALSQEAIKFIRSEVCLLLPNDRSGRSVVCGNFTKVLLDCPIDLVLQSLFYQHFILMRNPQNRLDGNVTIMIITADSVSLNPHRAKLLVELQRKALPVKRHSFHLMFSENGPNTAITKLLERYLAIFSSKTVHAHDCKTPEERAAALEPFGFTKERLPKIMGGSWELVQWDGLCPPNEQVNYHATTSLKRCPIEPNSERIQLPGVNKYDINSTKKHASLKSTPLQTKSKKCCCKKAKLHDVGEFDVLLGKGWVHAKHHGNQRFRDLIDLHKARYKAAESRIDKKQVKLEVLNCIREKGRIMQYDHGSNTWKEVSTMYALEKMTESFRNASQNLKKAPNISAQPNDK